MNPSGMGNDPMGVDLGAKHPHTQGEPLHRVTSMRSSSLLGLENTARPSKNTACYSKNTARPSKNTACSS